MKVTVEVAAETVIMALFRGNPLKRAGPVALEPVRSPPFASLVVKVPEAEGEKLSTTR